MRNTMHSVIHNIEQVMKGVPIFGKPDCKPLELIRFLQSFEQPCDSSVVNEGLVIELVPFFVYDRVKSFRTQVAPIPCSSGTAQVTDCACALKEPIGVFLDEDRCEHHARDLRTAMAKPWEDTEQFGSRLWESDYELGTLLTDGELLFAEVQEYVLRAARNSKKRMLSFNSMMHY